MLTQFTDAYVWHQMCGEMSKTISASRRSLQLQYGDGIGNTDDNAINNQDDDDGNALLLIMMADEPGYRVMEYGFAFISLY